VAVAVASVVAATALACAAWILAQPEPEAAGATAALVVDGAGRGGRCDDGRSAAQARMPATPLCSITRALALAHAGTTIAVRGGSYPALEVSGLRPARPIVVEAWRSGRTQEAVHLPAIRLSDGASHLRFRGLRLTGSATAPSFQIMDGGSRDVQLAGSRITSAGQDAVELRWGTSNVTLERNWIHTTGRGSGVVFAETSDLPGAPYREARVPIRDVIIRGNHFDGIAVDAIRPANFDGLVVDGNEIEGIVENGEHCDAFQSVFGGRRLVFRNNYLHDNAGQGLFIKDGRVTGAVVENNIFVHNRLEIQVQLFDTVGLRFVNNTVWDNQLNMILRRDVRDAVIRNNLIQDLEVEDPAAARRELRQDHNVIGGGWSWGAQRGDLHARPRFVDAARMDYRLAAGSPGVDRGTAKGAPRRDKACRVRGKAPDSGALERAAGSSAADTAAHPRCAQ
jgi:hypothetical protein